MNFRTIFFTTMLVGGVTGFLVTPLFRSSADVKKSLHSYSTVYRGLQVGRSTLPEVIGVLGQPLSKKVNSNNVLYAFKDAAVSIQDATQRINTIIITDPGYVDVNGYSIGADYALIENDPKTLDNNNVFSKTLFNRMNGVFYHFKNDHVEKIVYCESALY